MRRHESFRPAPARRRLGRALCLGFLALFLAVFAGISAKAQSERPLVDLELVLAVDVSSSMSAAEQEVQRQGYVSAFRHPELMQAVSSGALGVIAVAYLEWAGPDYQRVVLPWTMIGSDDQARRFADALAVQPILGAPGTSISAGLLQAEELFARSRSISARRVIDLSGDGRNNSGPPIGPVRDRLVAAGISINGLPISLLRGGSSRFESFDEHYLESYFAYCVVGGPDAFVIGIDDLAQFEVAVRRKLVREIAGRSPRPQLASFVRRSSLSFDCSALGELPGR